MDDYEIEDALGEGSFGTVFQVREISTNNRYALKVVNKRHVVRAKKVKYVGIEKKVLMEAVHPFILKLHATFQNQENLYYLLELAERGDLLQLLKRFPESKAPMEVTRFYIAEILIALDYLHSRDIIHRDLKPENVLLGSDYHIKLCDFGSSKIGKSQSKSFVGTAEYSAPEMLNDLKVDLKVDIWALGCIMYQMLCGRTPFQARNDYLCFQKIIARELYVPDYVDPTARTLIDQMLDQDPEQRLTINQARLHCFFAKFDFTNLWLQQAPDMDTLVLKPLEIYTPLKVPDQEPLNETCLFPDEHIIKRGTVVRKSILRKKGILVLTSTPRLMFVNADLTLKKEIQWTKRLMSEYIDSSHFAVHSSDRVYYFESQEAKEWVDCILAQRSRLLSPQLSQLLSKLYAL